MKQYKNRDWLYAMYITNNLSQSSISKICGVNQSMICRFLIRFNIPRRKFCGRSGKYCSQWKGGKYRTTQGYIHILKPNHPNTNCKKYIPEQILIVEKHLKRYLTKLEAIHHINEIKDDNHIENLYLFPSEAEHQRYHQNFRFGNIPQITKSNLL